MSSKITWMSAHRRSNATKYKLTYRRLHDYISFRFMISIFILYVVGLTSIISTMDDPSAIPYAAVICGLACIPVWRLKRLKTMLVSTDSELTLFNGSDRQFTVPELRRVKIEMRSVEDKDMLRLLKDRLDADEVSQLSLEQWSHECARQVSDVEAKKFISSKFDDIECL